MGLLGGSWGNARASRRWNQFASKHLRVVPRLDILCEERTLNCVHLLISLICTSRVFLVTLVRWLLGCNRWTVGVAELLALLSVVNPTSRAALLLLTICTRLLRNARAVNAPNNYCCHVFLHGSPLLFVPNRNFSKLFTTLWWHSLHLIVLFL